MIFLPMGENLTLEKLELCTPKLGKNTEGIIQYMYIALIP